MTGTSSGPGSLDNFSSTGPSVAKVTVQTGLIEPLVSDVSTRETTGPSVAKATDKTLIE